MDILRIRTGAVHAAALGLVAAALTAVALLLVAVIEARGDVAPAGTALADTARAAATGSTPLSEDAARRLMVDAGLSTARVIAPDGSVIATRGPAGRWTAGPASLRARPAGLFAGGWSLRDGVLEARGAFPDGGQLVVRTSRRAEHGEVGGLLWIGLIALLAGLLAAARGLAVTRSRARAAGAVAASVAALPAAPARGPARRDEWTAVRREVRRAASRWTSADARRGPGEIAALLDPLDHPVVTRDPRGVRAENPAFEALRRRLLDDESALLDERLGAVLARRGACADRVSIASVGHLDIEAWDAGDARIAAITDRREADRLAALRRRISGAARRHLTAPLQEIRRQASALADAGEETGPLRITAATDRLESVISRMLRDQDVRETGVAPRPIGLPGLLWGLARRWDDELRSRALRVELDLAPGLPAISADAALLDEVLSEVVDNAAGFSPRGEAIVLAAAADGDDVVITIRDAGPGLPADEVAAAREPFWRSDAADAVPGTGLGLGVADALTQRIGGRLEIDPGPGGCVRVILPVATAAVPEAA